MDLYCTHTNTNCSRRSKISSFSGTVKSIIYYIQLIMNGRCDDAAERLGACWNAKWVIFRNESESIIGQFFFFLHSLALFFSRSSVGHCDRPLLSHSFYYCYFLSSVYSNIIIQYTRSHTHALDRKLLCSLYEPKCDATRYWNEIVCICNVITSPAPSWL